MSKNGSCFECFVFFWWVRNPYCHVVRGGCSSTLLEGWTFFLPSPLDFSLKWTNVPGWILKRNKSCSKHPFSEKLLSFPHHSFQGRQRNWDHWVEVFFVRRWVIDLDLLPLPTQEASHKWRFIVYRCLYGDSLLTRNIPGGDWYGRWEIRVIHVERDFKKNCLKIADTQRVTKSHDITHHIRPFQWGKWSFLSSDGLGEWSNPIPKHCGVKSGSNYIPSSSPTSLNGLAMEKHGLLWDWRCTIPFTEAHDSGKGRFTLPNSGRMNAPAAFFVVWSFFQSIFPQLFLLLRGKDKKRSLLKGFWYGFWSRVWLSCPIAFCGNRWFQFLRTHSLFGKSLAFLVSAAILYCFNIKFEEYPL